MIDIVAVFFITDCAFVLFFFYKNGLHLMSLPVFSKNTELKSVWTAVTGLWTISESNVFGEV